MSATAQEQDEQANQPADPPAPVTAEQEATDAPPTDPAASPERTTGLMDITVIGSREQVRDLPGSGYFLETEDIRTQSYDDINRILRRVPGVYVREEDGYGLFPNISIRGTDSGRSAKLTIMEDGVLLAPAPYSAPAVYNNVSSGRMSGIEVLKGSSQVQYGPHVTGGVLNYIATPIPTERTGYLKTLYGTNNDIRVHGYFGDVIDTEHYGTFSFLLEGYFRGTDGFKTIDTTPDFRDGDQTGFTNVEPMLKIAWEPPTDIYHRFEAKVGYTDRNADETYLGLSTEDFRRDPFRRYSASRFDNIEAEAWRTHVRHYMEPTENLDFTSTIYYNQFQRNWYKLADLENVELDNNTTTGMSLSAALAGAEGGQGLEALKGQRRTQFDVRANNREYYSWGAETVGRHRFDTEGADHELTFGLRYHYDQVRRFQHEDRYQQEANGTISDVTEGAPGSQAHRRQETDALAFFVQDEIDFGRLTLTPGARFEHLWQEYRDYNSGDSGTGTLALLGGGMGATYDLDEQWQLFGGVHRGFSPPGPRAAIRGGLDEETSIASELGLRYETPNQAFRGEVAGFYTRFDDLIAIGFVGTGTPLGDPENVGKVDSYGAELSFEYDPGIDYNWGFKNPWHAAVTYTRAELASDATSDDAGSMFAGGRKGNRVPYIPEWTIGFGTGVETDQWGIFLNAFWVDEMFTTASNTRQQEDVDGNPDARFGTTDSHIVVDLAAHYNLTENAKLLGGVHNIFNEEYIASRHPHGPRPGQERFLYLGMEVNF
ncbi:MAG: TonB-dependent receptor [Phycisphaeraceae bacterium]